MNHVALLGDSIFDNEHYVADGDPDVVAQLRTCLPDGWQATLLAVDGAVTADVSQQLNALPDDCSHLIVSAGGNDAIGNSHLLENLQRSAAEVLMELSEVQGQFQRDYQSMLQAVLSHKKPTVVCTIYDSVPDLPPVAVTALSVFNDVILREAVREGLPVLDLRLVCNQRDDYSTVSPIEPSRLGGAKIARGLARIVTEHNFKQSECIVYQQ